MLPLILTGAGISPAAFARRQLRSDIENNCPAAFALTASGRGAGVAVPGMNSMVPAGSTIATCPLLLPAFG